MTLLISGLVVFFGAHLFSALRSREAGKDLRVKMGYGPYMGLYSLVSIIGFVLIVYGYGASRGGDVLYVAPSWGRHVNMLFMLISMILLIASQLPAGKIKKVTKHPMLLSVKLWAFGHLLANGELNSVLLFGSFLAYAVFDRIMVKRRGDTGVGSHVQLSTPMDIVSVVVSVGLWAALVYYLHPILFGVPVIA